MIFSADRKKMKIKLRLKHAVPWVSASVDNIFQTPPWVKFCYS